MEFNLEIKLESELEKLLKKETEFEESIKETDARIQEMYKEIHRLNEHLSLERTKRRELSYQINIAREEERKRELERAQAANMEDIFRTVHEILKDVPGYITPNHNGKKLHTYQIEDVVSTIAAYVNNLGGMLNANDMSMGKTAEAAFVIHVLQKIMDEKPKILWLTKKSLKESTPKELRRWFPDLKILATPETTDVKQRSFFVDVYASQKLDILLTNYEFVRTTPHVSTVDWDIVVVDEVHKLKGGANPSGPTAIWTAVKNIAAKAKFKFMISGTPMVNAPEEMWSYLHIFRPDAFPDLKSFRKNFMAYKNLAGEFTDQLTVEPNKIMEGALKGRMIRRALTEVGIELADFHLEDVELEMLPEQRAMYNQMRDQFFVRLDEMGEVTLTAQAIIAQLIRLRQLNTWADGVKVPLYGEEGEVIGHSELKAPWSSKIDEIEDRLAGINDQVVVFSTLNGPLFETARRAKAMGLRCEIIHGQAKHDFDIEAEFQNGKIDVLCINSAMGEGLNLHKNPTMWKGGARYGFMIDKWWSPARNEQCIRRIWRQGSVEPVFFYNLVNTESVDGFLQLLNDEKNEKFGSIMNDNRIRPAHEWKQLLREML